MKLVNTPKDSDYAYIDTFIGFLTKIMTAIADVFDRAIESLGKLMKLTEKEEEAE